MAYINNQNQLRSKCLECGKSKTLKETDKYGGICEECADEIIDEMRKTKKYLLMEINFGKVEAFDDDDALRIEEEGNIEWYDRVVKIVPNNIKDVQSLVSLGKKTVKEFKKITDVLREKLDNSITWSVDDFEGRATMFEKMYNDSKYGFYNRNKFKDALKDMIGNYDANFGITWSTLDSYLDSHCIDVKPENWNHTWEQISLDTALKIWDQIAVFGYDVSQDVSSLLNSDDDSKFDSKELMKYDYLFIENEKS